MLAWIVLQRTCHGAASELARGDLPRGKSGANDSATLLAILSAACACYDFSRWGPLDVCPESSLYESTSAKEPGENVRPIQLH